LSVDPIDRLEAAAQKAEDAWRNGDFAAALQLYARAMSERLANNAYGVDPTIKLEAADLVVMERLSDLARLFGRGEAADELLSIAINQISAAGNDYWADLLRVKRVDLALGCARLRHAQALLDEMSSSIGDVRDITFTRAGLRVWEQQRRWTNANQRDRVTIFTLLSFVMGRLLASLGQYEQAEVAFQNGLNHAQPEPGARGFDSAPQELAKLCVVPLKLSLARALMEKGDPGRATAYLDQLKGQIDEKEQPALFVQRLELEGKLNLSVGDLGAALTAFRQVLDLCAGRGFARASVAAALNLAHVLILLNQTREACNYLLVTRQRANDAGDFASVARAESLLQLAVARAQSTAANGTIAKTVTEQWGLEKTNRKLPAADHAAPDVPAEGKRAARAFSGGINPLDLPQSDNYLAFFEERALGFQWLLAQGELGACADYLDRLKEIFASTDSLLIKLRLQVLSGMLAYYQLNFEQAEKLLTASQSELRRLGLIPELWQTQRIIGWCRLKLSHDQSLLAEAAKENAELLREMAGSLAQEDRVFFLLNKWTVEEEELALYISRLDQFKTKLTAAPWYRRWRLHLQFRPQLDEFLRLVDRYRDMTAAWTTGAPEQGAASGPADPLQKMTPPPKFWRLWWRGKRGHATISFLVLPEGVLIFRSSRFKLDFSVSPATRIAVRAHVREWHEIIAKITQGKGRDLGSRPQRETVQSDDSATEISDLSAQARRVAERLSTLLQLPAALDDLPRSTRTLTLVLDDCLHGFPFAAISDRGSFLIERYALAFAYRSCQPEPALPARGRNALLVGASHVGGDWAELDFVPRELDSVGNWAEERKLAVHRLDDARPEYAAPDKATMLKRLPQCAVAHVACHGVFKPDQPGQSGMVLSGGRQTEVLSVQELAALDLTSLQHVTLSACWSADHFILPGRWVISLPETLARAGAQSVLGCLWPVEDRIGTAFMSQFYQHLNKYTRAEALRQTQLACLKGKLEVANAANAAQPIFWAGFQLYGSGDALKL
jgi:CHAT domain-containing protein